MGLRVLFLNTHGDNHAKRKNAIACKIISQTYELSECNMESNQCILNINNVYSYSKCPNSLNLTQFYWKMVTLSDKDIITFINATEHNNSNYNIPDYIHKITIRDSNESLSCALPPFKPFLFEHQCNEIKNENNIGFVLFCGVVTGLIGTGVVVCMLLPAYQYCLSYVNFIHFFVFLPCVAARGCVYLSAKLRNQKPSKKKCNHKNLNEKHTKTPKKTKTNKKKDVIIVFAVTGI